MDANLPSDNPVLPAQLERVREERTQAAVGTPSVPPGLSLPLSAEALAEFHRTQEQFSIRLLQEATNRARYDRANTVSDFNVQQAANDLFVTRVRRLVRYGNGFANFCMTAPFAALLGAYVSNPAQPPSWRAIAVAAVVSAVGFALHLILRDL